MSDRRTTPHARTANILLASLPQAELNALLPRFERVELPLRAVLEPLAREPEAVVFLLSGIASRVAYSRDQRLEVGLMGREGMAGLGAMLGAGPMPHEVFMQVAGTGLRMEAKAFRSALEECPGLRDVMHKWIHVCFVQMQQTALANARHTLEERLARWLLMSADRLDARFVPLTHEFMALMLGVHRPGVTLAMHTLEGAGLIKAERGKVTIVDRAALEEVAGDGYGIAEAESRRLFGA